VLVQWKLPGTDRRRGPAGSERSQLSAAALRPNSVIIISTSVQPVGLRASRRTARNPSLLSSAMGVNVPKAEYSAR
jgi:hypothetical protein